MIAVSHLEVVHDFAFVPDVVAGSQNVDAQLKQFFSQLAGNAETSRRIFAVGDDQIDSVIFDQIREAFFDDSPPRAAEDVTNEKNAHA